MKRYLKKILNFVVTTERLNAEDAADVLISAAKRGNKVLKKQKKK